MSEQEMPSRAGRDEPVNGSLDLPPVHYFILAKGFARLFWGLLMALILFFGNASVEVFHVVRVPAYVMGCALAGWGLWILPAAGAVTPKWRRRVHTALALMLLEIYFAPFFEWWKMSPHTLFYLVNMLGLLLVSMLALFYVNRLAADVFRRLRDRAGQMEALIFAAGVVMLMIAPLVLTVFFCLLAAIRYKTDFEFEMWQTVVRLPLWAYMFLTIPCSLTLIAAWKVRTLCYACAIRDDTDNPPDC